jgi:hypothetical protein
MRMVVVERVKGIEPSPKAWEAFVLPLNYTRTATVELFASPMLEMQVSNGAMLRCNAESRFLCGVFSAKVMEIQNIIPFASGVVLCLPP